MNKKWYRSSLAKGILIAVFHGALVLTAVCGLFLIAMAANGIEIWGDHGNSYVETKGFVDSLEASATNILSGLNAQAMYEESAFGEKVVDLKEIMEGREITYGNHSGLAYSLKDLKDWVEKGWEQGGYEDGETILMCICQDSEEIYYYYYEDILRMVEDGTFIFELGDLRGMSQKEMAEEILNSLRYGTYEYEMYDDTVLSIEDKARNVKYRFLQCYDGEWIREEYAPVGADSILDAVNESQEWNGRLNDAFRALQESLYTTASYCETEEKLKSYGEGNTNLTYLYVNLDKGKIRTNRTDEPSLENYEDVLMEMAGQEAYIILKPKLGDCATNLDLEGNDSLQMWQHMAYNQIDAENYVFAVSVDGSFPVEDSFARADGIYRKYESRRTPAVQGMIFGALLLLASLIWLTAIAGKRPGDAEVHLNGFDRIFTEIAALGVFGVWAVCITIPLRILETQIDYDSVPGVMLVSGSALFTAAMFLLGYLSMVRRIKGRTLWKNSLLRWCLGLLRKLWQKAKAILELFSRNTPGKIKVTLLTCGFVLLQFLGFALMIDADGIFFLPLAVLDCWTLIYMIKKADGNDRILDGVKRISGGELQYKIPSEKLTGDQKRMAEYINHIGEGLDAAVENSLKNERMKTELITNVSHDIKTPLTSIINYVDLLKRENFTDPKICGYLDVLESKALRLKVLTEDVVEASKASAGTITLDMRELNFSEMLYQVMGEFEERFEERNLTLMVHLTEEPVVISADGQRLWRVLDNVFNNVVKYALEGTRVYVQTTPEKGRVVFSLKNISAQPLNISPEELTERFIRGDVSRNTEGSGLGLSIAKSLTELQGGDFRLYLDGDLFKVIITFPLVTKKEK